MANESTGHNHGDFGFAYTCFGLTSRPSLSPLCAGKMKTIESWDQDMCEYISELIETERAIKFQHSNRNKCAKIDN